MQPTPPDLRPLELGELIDRSISFWRSHLKPLFALGLGFQLVLYTMLKSIVLGTRSWMPQDPKDYSHVFDNLPGLLGGISAMLVVGVLYAWTYWGSLVAASAYVVPNLLHRPATPGSAVRRMFARWGAITSSMFLLGVVFTVVLLLLAIPMGVAFAFISSVHGSGAVLLGLSTVLWFFLGVIALFWLWVRIALTGPVIAYEELGGVRSLLRSSRLISGRVGPGFMGRVLVRASIVFAVIFMLLSVISVISAIPTYVLAGIYGGLTTGALAVPQSLLVPAELFQVVVQGLFAPIAWVFASIFYLDLRVRKEGLDLELQLEPVAA